METISFPYKILIDNNIDNKVEEFLSFYKAKKICIISSGMKFKPTETIKKKFNADIIEADSTELKDIKKINLAEYDLVIGMGGGKTIDIAKYASFLSGKRWIAFPTILSHDGVLSSRAVINENKDKISVTASEPSGIIVDLEIIKNSPYKYTTAGFGDLLSNLTSVEDWRLSKEDYNSIIANLALLSANSVIENIEEIKECSYHGLNVLAWSLICSGFAMNIYGSSRPCSGSEHNFSHALDKMGSKALHGEQVALGSIISCYLQGSDWKRIQNIMKQIGLPTTAKDLGIENIVVKALVDAKNIRKRYSILDKMKIDEKKAREILKTLEII